MQKLKTTTILILFLFAFVCRASFAQSTRTLSLKLENKKLPFGLTQKVPAGLPRIGLALSGGGARSFAQLGVLRALEEGNIPIDIIAGTSMGSIIGGLYSAGYSISELDSIINDAPWDSFFSVEEADRNELFLDKKITEDKAIVAFRLEGLRPVLPTAVNTGQRVANFLNLLSINAPIHVKSDFDELLYNFRAVCTNFVTGEGEVLKSGLLSRAMRASSSVSLLLEPVKIDSLVLADGGLVSNVPVMAVKNSGADYIIAVDNTSPLHNEEELNYPWNVADQLVSIPIKNLNDVQLKDADFIIQPEIGPHSNTDFTINETLIENGYYSSINLIDSIKNEIARIYKSSLNGEEFFVNNLTVGDNPTDLEKEIIKKYSKAGTVSSRDLYYDLYSIYNRGNYKNVLFELNEDSSATELKIITEEMPIVKKISLNGIIIIDFEKAKKIFDPLTGRPFNSRLVLRSLLDLMRMYRTEGFSLAGIESVFFDELSQHLEINVSEGMISDVVVKGNNKTDVELITREFPLLGGEYFKYQNLKEGLTNLRATNLFENIELLIVKNNDENILEIQVEEKVSSLIRLGVRIDNENLTQVLADVRDENFLGTGTELGAMLSGGIRNQSYTLEHRVYRIFNTYLTYTLRGFYKSEEINVYQPDTNTSKTEFYRNKVSQYTQSQYGGSFGIGTQIKKLGNIILEGKYQRSEIGSIPGYSGTLSAYDLFSLKLELAIDSRNKYPHPTYGSSLRAYYETAQTILSGDQGYSKLYLDYKNIFSLGSVHTFNTGIKLGFADKTLPLSEYFSMGGQNNFFGLRNHEFRGRQIFVTSAEYQLKLPFKIFFDTYLLFRYDLGAVWAVQEEIKFRDLLHGIGTTISLDTPLGPADFSIGKSFTFVEDRAGSTPAWGETLFYFTIGYYY